ncbi:G-type lectin S-receptor-like serine/threonine-protein kinase At2g19130 [Ziziphus jujuba]|uniref:Receptor-like serine/threonine-protein kinase n=1 Tax=Ziziphus jujuba TaxID=326968 RepID=A0A6P4A5G6_ZIZJJ|nr:G-type lectin S-receptor-like serine/threonine-protein kinase At2g19130 [Ziziphus jujuba]XP_060672332.1 G-type lectin S-receptor-like serine/threonine-protein kinase At2g19130 [Ziziphus jujuba]XP_060672333.1 G-type lectin S-receptor-like serine/threonine-protein kinase At2g19130 [Ziziphus jujuba]XP_060672334.1 G-type lectin S-receptor-like serine/threonine-protein kinase At2g19130 [Ziziphus jujuba]XP_060672335.1 G-type lectin S-receptor-like serine/threonine-protein kinase At2g19130 [Ziziphu
MDMMKDDPRFMLAVLFLCLFLKTHICHGADRISGNQTLTGDQTIVSAGEIFELGFFKPVNSSKYYIGMWYKRISERTIVWVANRETPVSDRFSSVLRISDGNLVLFNESQIQIWSTNVSSSGSSSVQAVLEDNGNLVLKEGSNNSRRILWESFDHPAHTWLPGSKLGYNNITKKNQRLISWRTSEDPAPGLFSLELDTSDNSYKILWNGSVQYWTSGPWNENTKIFDRVPEMRLNYIYDFHFVSNNTEKYFTYSVKDNSTTSRFLMDVSGQIKQQNWLGNGWNLFWSQPRQQCEVYAYCGAYGNCNEESLPFCNCVTGFEPKSQSNWDIEDYSVGCRRKTPLQSCGNNSTSGGGNGERDKFLQLTSMSLPNQSLSAGSAAQCESTCLNNCSCTAYSLDDNDCLIWIGDFLDLEQLSEDDGTGRTFYVRLAASELPNPKKKNGVIIGVAVGSAVGISVFLCLIVFVILRRRKKIVKPGKTVEGSLMAYDYRYLQNATKNFSEKLGGGGFGSVFKGTLPDQTVIAVKQLESFSQGEKQFRTEVSTIGTIQHVNLVRLRGFCSEGAKRLLVYDYMSNGSLDSHIFREKTSNLLDWKTRYQIALGTARGLYYLHEKCRDCIIHCDIKPENILLDSQFIPKVADFGLAKLVGRDFSRVLTTMRGTRGYLAPEWISGVAITAKADVFSFGMMLFEFVSGRRNSEQSEDGKVKFFPRWAASVIIDGGDVLSLLDPSLERNADVEEITRVCRVACWCIQDDENRRPTMGQIVQILEGVIDVNLPPVPRSLQVFVDDQENVIFYTESSSSQSSQTRSNTSTASSQAKSTTSSKNSLS